MTYQANLSDKAVIVQLNCSFSWGNITDKTITRETNDNKGAIAGAMHVRKKLLPATSGLLAQQVTTTLSTFYQYHKGRTYSTPQEGQRLMPTAFYMDYMEKFGAAQAQATAALDALVAGFPAAVELAKTLLVDSFNAADYPEPEDIRRYCTLKVRFLPVPSGDHIMNALGAGVAADVDAYVGQVLTSAAADAKARLLEVVERVRNSCRPDGKIYDTMTDALEELVSSLPEIAGLTQDVALQKLINDVKQNLTGFTAKDLRESPGARTEAALAAAEIIKRMSGG